MTDATKIAQEVAREYACLTNDKVETYFERTNESIQIMAASVSEMAQTVKESSKQLARYEERQNATAERMERLEQGLREQGIIQRTFEKEIIDDLTKMRDEIKDNSLVRKAAVALAAIIISAMIGGGLLFGNFTGKGTHNANTEAKATPVK